jgi:hypothetical protein
LKDYDANEVVADEKYKGKKLAVTGKVKSIEKDYADDIIVRLITDKTYDYIMAYGIPANAAKSLSKGQLVTITCRGNGMTMGNPKLNSCILSG